MQDVDEYKPIIYIRYVTRGTAKQTIMESLYDAFNVVNDPEIKNRATIYIEVLTDN